MNLPVGTEEPAEGEGGGHHLLNKPHPSQPGVGYDEGGVACLFAQRQTWQEHVLASTTMESLV